MTETINNNTMDWDSPINPGAINEDGGFKPLAPGEYDFRILSMKRERFNGSEKMKPCPMANLELAVFDADGHDHKVLCSLFLNDKMAWKMLQFFVCIGQRQKGSKEMFLPNWSQVPGSTGRCKITSRKYTGKDGSEKTASEVDRWIEPSGAVVSDNDLPAGF